MPSTTPSPTPSALPVPEILQRLAAKYIWWKTPDAALRYSRRVVAQVMDLGTFEDVALLQAAAGEEAFADALGHAEAGWFSPRSWTYWHYRLGLVDLGQVPPLPERKTA